MFLLLQLEFHVVVIFDGLRLVDIAGYLLLLDVHQILPELDFIQDYLPESLLVRFVQAAFLLRLSGPLSKQLLQSLGIRRVDLKQLHLI